MIVSRLRNIGYLFFLLLVIASCSATKKTHKFSLVEISTDDLLVKMQQNESQFHTLSAKALIDITSQGKTNSLKATIRMTKDSAIWVSISAGMGLEAARILLTRDSVLFINRLNKTYFVGNYKFINHLINAQVDFDIIQALLTGNDFKWYDYQDIEASIMGSQYQLESANRRKLKKYIKSPDCASQVIYQSMWLNPESFKIERIKIKEIKNENKKIVAEYSHFKTIDGQILPAQYDITISAQNDIIIDATFMKISLNKSIKFPFNIPSKYKETQVK